MPTKRTVSRRPRPPEIQPAWFIGLGLFWMALGGGVILTPLMARWPVGPVLGVALFMAGIAQIIHAAREKSLRAVAIESVNAILFVAAGLLLLVGPFERTVAVALVVAALLAAEGLARLAFALRYRHARNAGWNFFATVTAFGLAAAAGFRWPAAAPWVLGLAVGLYLGLAGWGLFALGRAARRPPPRT